MRLYRALLALYPRAFRREYGDDMAALLEAQLRDERSLRIIGRTSLDLLLTIPPRHLEARMPRSASTPLIITFVAAAAVFTVTGGAIGLAVGAALLTLTAVWWRRQRPVVERDPSRSWKALLAGVVLLGALVVVTRITGELPSGGWFVAMGVMFTSFGLIGWGVVTGLAGRVR